MAKISDIVAKAKATVGHVIRVFRGGVASPQPNRPNLDFAGNCTVQDTGDAIRVTIPAVPSGTVTAGRTITLPAGSLAYVHNLGTPEHQILEFGIPLSKMDLEQALEVFQGGTGANNADDARKNLDVPSNEELAEAEDRAAKLALERVDSIVVKLEGDQEIAGVKTFTESPVIPTPDATDNSTNAATTAWVRAYVESRLGEIYYYAKDGTSPEVDPPVEAAS